MLTVPLQEVGVDLAILDEIEFISIEFTDSSSDGSDYVISKCGEYSDDSGTDTESRYSTSDSEDEEEFDSDSAKFVKVNFDLDYIVIHIGFTSRIIDKDTEFEKVSKKDYPEILLVTQDKFVHGYRGGKDYLPFPNSKSIRKEIGNILVGGEVVFDASHEFCALDIIKSFKHLQGLDDYNIETTYYVNNNTGKYVVYHKIDTE
jgi:hypothetical protein